MGPLDVQSAELRAIRRAARLAGEHLARRDELIRASSASLRVVASAAGLSHEAVRLIRRKGDPS